MFVPKSLMIPVIAVTLALGFGGGADSALAHGHHGPCVTCCQPCPPPPPVMKKLCVVDPCTGCTYEACLKIPAACCGEEPCMTWRWGIFGRKVLTYTWKCCGHCVDIVITKHGRIIVRG
jgi:hypothetical protein